MSHIVEQEKGGQLDGLKAASVYKFDPSTNLIVVNDIDFDRIVSVFNSTTDNLIFNVDSETFTGTAYKNELVFNASSTGMSDNDKLYIIYKPIHKNGMDSLLQKIIDKIEITNKLLTKIKN